MERTLEKSSKVWVLVLASVGSLMAVFLPMRRKRRLFRREHWFERKNIHFLRILRRRRFVIVLSHVQAGT
jgi:hypothetical protein